MEDNNLTPSVVRKDEARKILPKGDGQNDVFELDHSSEISANEDSCESTICTKTIDTDVRANDYESGTFLQTTTQGTDNDFVTVEEVEASVKQKEDDSLCSDGSHSCGSILDSLETDKFDSSLNALKEKKNQLLDSLRNVLADSSGASPDTSVIEVEDQMNTSVATVVSDFENSEYRSNIGTSTPFPESKPMAARFLRKWKPSFISEEICEIDEEDSSDDPYEKAMAGLKQVLSDTSADMASKLDSYSNMLDLFQSEDDKKYDEMISKIASENDNLEECFQNVPKEVDEFIEKFSEGNIGVEPSIFVNQSTIEIDSEQSTIVARDETITISDTEKTINDVSKTPLVITIDSSQTENDETLVESKETENSQPPVESMKPDVSNDAKPTENDQFVVESKQSETSETPDESTKSNVSSNRKPTDNVPNDLEILIIGGDDDIDINVDDEDLLLASDDEAKHNKSEKKNQPQIPLVKDLEVFYSDDPDENKDNNDPKWDYLRNLGTDYDRYLAVRARWKNIQIPNPKRDLTCRCRNPINQLPNTFNNQNNNNGTQQNHNNNNNRTSKKRSHSPENQYKFSKRARKESCTVLFDRNIDQLAEDVNIERQRIMNEQEQALQQLADIQHMEKYVTKQKGGTMLDMQRLENKHIIQTRECVEDFRRRFEELIEMARAKLTALQKASEEVRQFHEFYPNEDEKLGDTKSLVYLTDEEVQEILEVEEMLLSFPTLYNE